MTVRTAAAVGGVTLFLFAVRAEGGDGAEVRKAVGRALPFVRSGGAEWIVERKCVTCHRVSFMTWTLSEASRRGFQVDAEEQAEWRRWSLGSLLERNEAGVVAGASNLEGVSQTLWSQDAAAPDKAAELRTLLIAGQREDGAWTAGGQLPSQKRPAAETDLVSTLWNALALGLSDDPAATAAREKAVAWIGRQPPGVSVEPAAMRLLLAVQSRADAAAPIAALRSRQREDGGWGRVSAEASDALATGQAVYALRAAEVPADDPSLRRAVAFLTGTQNADGSWTVRGTKAAKRDRPEETATYWGTCWAALGLMSTLDEAR